MPSLHVNQSLILYNWDHFQQHSSSRIIQKTPLEVPPYLSKGMFTNSSVAPPKSWSRSWVAVPFIHHRGGVHGNLLQFLRNQRVATTTIISWKKRNSITFEDKRIMTIFFPKLWDEKTKNLFFCWPAQLKKNWGVLPFQKACALAPSHYYFFDIQHRLMGYKKNKYYPQPRIARQPNFHQLLPLALGLSSATLDWFSRCDTTLWKPSVVWATKIGHLTYPAAKQAIVL